MTRAEDLKRWQWIIVGLLIGLALSFMRANMDVMPQARTMEKQRFESLLREPPLSGGHPVLRNIVVYPPRQSEVGVKDRTGKIVYRWCSLITFQWLHKQSDGTYAYSTWSYNAIAKPYEPLYTSGVNVGPGLTPQDYVAQVAKRNSWIQFKYAWWTEPRAIYIIWTGTSVLLIGGIWPFILNLLIGAGFGHRTDPQAKADRAYRRSKPQAKAAAPAPTQMSQEDLDRMKQMEAGLTGFLKSAEELAAEQQQQQTGPAPIRQLIGGSIPLTQEQQAAAAAAVEQQKKEYRGEFYPTIAHAPIKHEGDPASSPEAATGATEPAVAEPVPTDDQMLTAEGDSLPIDIESALADGELPPDDIESVLAEGELSTVDDEVAPADMASIVAHVQELLGSADLHGADGELVATTDAPAAGDGELTLAQATPVPSDGEASPAHASPAGVDDEPAPANSQSPKP